MKIKFISAIFLMGLAVSAHAHNKVVVIPMGDGPSAELYMATIAENGSIISRTVGVVNSANTSGAGSYSIIFDVPDVSKCFATATTANTNQDGVLRGSVGVTVLFDNPQGLFAKVLDNDGLDADGAFTVQLLCPHTVIVPTPISSGIAPTTSGGENEKK